MVDTLRKPFFVVAVVIAALVVLVDLGSAALLKPLDGGSESSAVDGASDLDQDEVEHFKQECLRQGDRPPGLGIPAQVLVDFLMLYAVGWMGVSLLAPERVTGRVQGIITLVVSLVVLVAGIAGVFVVFGLLMTMVSLLLAAPFGTIAYLVLYGHFPTGSAAVVLSLLMVCKLAFAVCLVLAHQRFLQNRSLVLLVLTSLLMTVVIGFLHGFVPGPLVSIADAIAALVCGILGVIWAVVLLIASVIATVKAVV